MRPCITVKMLQTVPLSEYINRRYGPLTEGGVGEKEVEFSVKYSNIDQIAWYDLVSNLEWLRCLRADSSAGVDIICGRPSG